MSSHHFVKEGQEPALIIAEPVAFEVVQSLLEWAPLVIVFEDAIDHVLSWGIKTDVILSANPPASSLLEKVSHQHPFEIVTSNKNQMLDDAIQLAIKKNQRFVTIAVADAPSYFERYKARLNHVDISIIDEHARWSFIQSGNFTKWLKANAIFYLQPNADFKIEGAVKQIDSVTYCVQSDSIILVISDSFFWIGEPIN
jgi:hypothetical protein